MHIELVDVYRYNLQLKDFQHHEFFCYSLCGGETSILFRVVNCVTVTQLCKTYKHSVIISGNQHKHIKLSFREIIQLTKLFFLFAS